MIAFLFKGARHLVHGGTDAHVKVGYFVIKESLEKLHFSLHVSQVAPVYLRENATASIVNSCNRLLFNV
jgi:hypothetical protein